MSAAVLMSNSHFSVFYKNRYPQRKIEDLTAYGKPFLSQCPKKDDLTGTKTIIPIEVDAPQGMSANLIRALTNVTSSRGVTLEVTPVSFYAGLTLDAKTMLAARDNEGAFFRAREHDTDRLLGQIGQNFEMQLWRTGSGRIGTVGGSDPSGGADITLSDSEDAINFHLGMAVYLFSNSSGEPGTVRTNVGLLYVSGINEDTGVISFATDSTLATPATIHADAAVGDHLVRDSGTTGIDNLVSGIPAWIPSSDPTTAFMGLTAAQRTANPQKLGGFRQSWLGTIEETCKRLDAKMRRVSQGGKQLWLSYNNFARLETELGARGHRVEDGSQGKWGRISLMMATPGGGVEVKCGPYCPEDTAFLLSPDTWEIHTLGGLPHLVQDDGLVAMRVGGGVASTAEDSIEIRYRAFWQLICTNPYANGRFPIA